MGGGVGRVITLSDDRKRRAYSIETFCSLKVSRTDLDESRIEECQVEQSKRKNKTVHSNQATLNQNSLNSEEYKTLSISKINEYGPLGFKRELYRKL